ncbi:MAG: ABC transporter ATP-binding protein [Acidobacteriota bacterium]
MSHKEELLAVRDLTVSVRTPRGIARPIRGVNLEIHVGEAVGLVGESGCGKSTLAAAAVRLLPSEWAIGGEIRWRGTNVMELEAEELRRIRGGDIGMVFQDPLGALDPLMKVGAQISEALRAHAVDDHGRRRTRELLSMVSLGEGVESLYPHQLSGGMRQRVMIAIALAAGPSLLLADEPVSALDAPLQSQLVDLLADLQRRLSLSLLLISHDLALVGRACSRIVVMYAGQVVEVGPSEKLLAAPLHPYTSMLLRAGCMEGPAGRESPHHLVDEEELCAFHPRCTSPLPCCVDQSPRLVESDGRLCRCHLNA